MALVLASSSCRLAGNALELSCDCASLQQLRSNQQLQTATCIHMTSSLYQVCGCLHLGTFRVSYSFSAAQSQRCGFRDSVTACSRTPATVHGVRGSHAYALAGMQLTTALKCSHLEVRVLVQQLALPAQGCAADHSPGREILQPLSHGGDEHIPHVFPLQVAGQHRALGQVGGHILCVQCGHVQHRHSCRSHSSCQHAAAASTLAAHVQLGRCGMPQS